MADTKKGGLLGAALKASPLPPDDEESDSMGDDMRDAAQAMMDAVEAKDVDAFASALDAYLEARS